jgi:hypothetical protein
LGFPILIQASYPSATAQGDIIPDFILAIDHGLRVHGQRTLGSLPVCEQVKKTDWESACAKHLELRSLLSLILSPAISGSHATLAPKSLNIVYTGEKGGLRIQPPEWIVEVLP